jgi:hypothetical protein
MLNDGKDHGTTIQFLYNDQLKEAILENFEERDSDPCERIGIVFGRDDVEVVYKHHEEAEPRILPMYNYFKGEDPDFYKGMAKQTIEHWRSQTEDVDRFIWNNLEILRDGRGYKSDVQKVSSNMIGYDLAGTYEVWVGLRRDTSVFDEECPHDLEWSDFRKTDVKFGTYNETHLHFIEGREAFLNSYKLVRNNQLIGLIPIESKTSSARANGMAYFDIQLLQCEIRYNPLSNQENCQDKVMGIQENKNQYSGLNVPKHFTRLVNAIKKEKSKEICEYFLALKKAFKPETEVVKPATEDNKPGTIDQYFGKEETSSNEVVRTVVPAPAPAPAPASESDSEPEPEPEPPARKQPATKKPVTETLQSVMQGAALIDTLYKIVSQIDPNHAYPESKAQECILGLKILYRKLENTQEL